MSSIANYSVTTQHWRGETYAWQPSSWGFFFSLSRKDLLEMNGMKCELNDRRTPCQKKTKSHISSPGAATVPTDKEVTWLREEVTQTRLKIPTWEAGSIIQAPGCSQSCAGCGQAAKPHLSEPSKTSPGYTHVAPQRVHFRKSHSCIQATQPLRNAALTWFRMELLPESAVAGECIFCHDLSLYSLWLDSFLIENHSQSIRF